MRPGFSGAAVRAAEQPLLDQGRGPALMAVAAHGLQLRCRRILRERRGRVSGARTVILAGKGNNGGDGLWAGAAVRRAGAEVVVLPTAGALHEEGAQALRAAGGTVLPWHLDDEHAEEALELLLSADLVLDAMLGTGASGGLRSATAELAEKFTSRMRQGGGPAVVAVDIPSGLSADGAALEAPVLPAEQTVTFAAAKTGQLTAPGDRLCGRIETVPIGVEHLLPSPEVLRLEDRDLDRLWPRPAAADHKYTRGVVGIVAGSPEYPGAALLSVRAALAAGTGMVRYLGDADTRRLIAVTSPEAVSSDAAPAEVHVQSWVAGSGAVDDDQQRRCEEVLAESLKHRLPAVLDAAALEMVGRSLVDRRLRPWIVLTPHAGELQKLLGWCEAWHLLPEGLEAPQREQIEADPARWARVSAQATGATVLLKGATTTIAAPSAGQDDAQAPVLTVGGGSPWLAAAGSGDTLAGMLGTLLAHDAAQPQHLEDRLPGWLRESSVPEQALEPLADALGGDARWALLAALATVLQARASHVGGEGPQPCRPEDIRAALTRVGV